MKFCVSSESMMELFSTEHNLFIENSVQKKVIVDYVVCFCVQFAKLYT